MVSSLAAEGVENLGYLEAYARKGKPGLAAAKAEAEAKIAEAEAAEAAANQTPRAKAAKQAAAILASVAKHGQMMTTEELQAIAGGVMELLLARMSVAADIRAADIARDVSAKAEAKAARLAA